MFDTQLIFKGVPLAVTGSYSLGCSGDYDTAPTGPEIEVKTSTIGGVDVWPLIEAAGWETDLENAICKHLELI